MRAYLIDFETETMESCAEIAKEYKLSRNAFVRKCVHEAIKNYTEEACDGKTGSNDRKSDR